MKINKSVVGKFILWLTFAFCIAIGSWSFYAYIKRGQLAKVFEERVAGNAYPIEEAWQDGALDNELAGNFLKVELEGQFFGSNQLFIIGRSVEGENGLHAIAPFVTNFGKVILVDRGFLPYDKAEAVERGYSNFSNKIAFSGIIRYPYPPKFFIPKNNPSANAWYSWNIKEMGKQLGINEKDLLNVYVLSEKINEEYPIGGQWRTTITNDAWSNAVIWWLMALALLFGYFINRFYKKNKK